MRNAPAVSAQLDGGRPERVLISLLYALGAALLVFWLQALAVLPASPPVWLAAASWIAAAAALGAALAKRALPSDGGQLVWDGQAWALLVRVTGDRMTATYRIPLAGIGMTLDLGAWLLLRLQPATGGTRWQVARARCVGPAWHGLRVALFAHSGRAADVTTLQPAAIPPPRRSP